MQPHSSQSSRENATPSSGTSSLASYKEVPPPPPGTFVEFWQKDSSRILIWKPKLPNPRFWNAKILNLRFSHSKILNPGFWRCKILNSWFWGPKSWIRDVGLPKFWVQDFYFTLTPRHNSRNSRPPDLLNEFTLWYNFVYCRVTPISISTNEQVAPYRKNENTIGNDNTKIKIV